MDKKERPWNSIRDKEVEVSSRRPSLSALGADRDKALARMGFRTLRDLLDYKPLQSARTLIAVARGLVPKPQLAGLVEEEYIRKDLADAVSWPVTALQNMADDEFQSLAAMGVKTIGDLAQLAKEADEAVLAALNDNGFRERTSAPAQLLPGMIGSVASSVRFTTFIRDVELRKLTFTVDEDCVVPLPVSPHLKHPGSLAEIFETQKCPVLHLGYMCDHRQRWINLGTHLGEVIHSLSLAPGESRNIALVNWRRRQLTALEERTTTSERLTATFVQNRAIEEITSAVAREHQTGETQTEANTSVTAGSFVAAGAVVGGAAGAIIGTLVEPVVGTLVGAAVGAGAGVVAGGLVYAGSQALGMIEADTKGDREIVAEVQQRISLSTSQTASAVRSLWSTVVVEDAQAEGVEATTSNITNYNHMHALNIEYYEILQHYLARIDVERVQPILFLPFTFFDFTNFRFVRDYWEAVRPHIDDEALQTQGDSYFVTEKEPERPDLLPVPPQPSKPGDPESLILRNLAIELLFNSSLPTKTAFSLTLRRGNQEVRGVETENGVQSEKLDGYDYGNRYKFEDIEDAQEITGVSLSRNNNELLGDPEDAKFHIRVATGNLRSASRQLSTLRGDVIKSNATMKAEDPITLTIPWNPAADFDTDNTLELEEYKQALKERAIVQAKNRGRQAAYEALVDNLNRFEQRLQNLILRCRHFFTRVILNAIEPEEITQLLEALRIGHTGIADPKVGIPLGDIADTIPLGMTTGAFVLKLKRLDEKAGGKLVQTLPIGKRVEELVTLLQYSDHTLAFFENTERKEAMAQTDHVYAPTGGLFAEAILGRANSAEYLDMERYFNWQDSPIPHQAPAIQPVGTESRFQQGEVNVNVPEGNLQVINPVNLPDPTGLQGVLAAIQNPNLFRDMSKTSELAGIIGSLSALAGQMGQAASTMTGQAAQQALQAATEVGKAAAGMAQSLMSEASIQTGGAPSTITGLGAALTKERELTEAGTGTGNGSLTGNLSGSQAGAPAGGGPTSTSEDIVRKAAGLPPTRSTRPRNRTLNVRLSFLSAHGVPMTFNVLAGFPKTFYLIHGNDARAVFDDTPDSAENGLQQMQKLVDIIYTFSLPSWSESNGDLILELAYDEGSFKGLKTVDIPASASAMVITARIAAQDEVITRGSSTTREQSLATEVQRSLGITLTAATKIVKLTEFGATVNLGGTDTTTNTDSTSGTASTTVTETRKVPTGALEINVEFKD